MFVFAAMAWTLWHARNKAVIEGRFIKHPVDIIYKMIIFMQLWKPLNKTEDASTIEVLLEKFCTLVSQLRQAQDP